MRTLILLGAATGSILLAGQAHSAPVTTDAATIAPSAQYGHPGPTLDYGAPAPADTQVYTGYPDRVPSEVDYRTVQNYDAQGRWTGTWNGTYETTDGQRYDGRYEGRYEGRVGTDYPPYDPSVEGYPPYYDGDLEQRCGDHGGTVGGAVIGGAVGAIAGNRIAGRGDRTAGTLIGGGLGAVAGAAIGSAADRERCAEYISRRESWYRSSGYDRRYAAEGATRVYRYGDAPLPPPGYGYGYGYGWYSPGVVVTTIITNAAPIVTETIETTTTYESVPVRKRYVAKKRWKPRPKPRCIC